MTSTNKTVDLFQLLKNVSNEAVDGLNEFLMEPFKSIWNQCAFISTGITFEWATIDILNALPKMVEDEWISESQADEVKSILDNSDVTTVTLFQDHQPYDHYPYSW